MRKVFLAVLTSAMLFTLPVMSAQASSLDEVVSGATTTTTQESSTTTTQESSTTTTQESSDSSNQTSSSYVSADEYIDGIKSASDLTSVDTKAADSVNTGIRTVAAIIVKVLSYLITAMLVVRVLVDLTYIVLPFTRAFLSNGYGGNAAAGGSNAMNSGVNMGGGALGGYGMGGYGMGGGLRPGYGGYRMGSMNMPNMNGTMPGATSQAGASAAMGRIQWVSTAALNATAAESIPGTDGKQQSALKAYSKEMATILIITPILLTLAVTGVLSDLGFLIGDVICRGIENLGAML